MYFPVFLSNEYYSDEDIQDNITIFEKDICIICWMPDEKNNEVKHLSEFSHIITTCKCQPTIHSLCLDSWIIQNSSCPICRTKISIHILNSNKRNILTNVYVNSIKYIRYFFKILSVASFINVVFLLFYHLCYIYFVTIKCDVDSYEIY